MPPLQAEFELSYLLIEGALNSREGTRALNRLQLSSRPPGDAVVQARLPWPCPGPRQCWPGSNLCHAPQGLLQPLSFLCLQGCLLLEPQGFLEWCWEDKERVVRVSALVRNSTVPLPIRAYQTTAYQGASKAMSRGQRLRRPHSGTSALTEQTRPQEVQRVTQGTQLIGRELDVESRPDLTQDDQPRQYP